jgi:hypothetical protein
MVRGRSLSSLAFLRHSRKHRHRASSSIIFLLFLFLLRASVVMAWFCSGRSNTELVQRLRSAHVITSERVKEVGVWAGEGTVGRIGR